MKIDTYLASLLPSVEKVKIKEQLRNAQEELTDKTLPPYKASLDFFTPKYSFKSEAMKRLQTRFQKKLNRREANMIQAIHTALTINIKNINKTLSLVDEKYANDIVADGLSLLQVNILQYAESLSYVNMFSRRVLLLAYGLESMNPTDERGLSRDLRWVEANFDNFLICLKAHFGGEKQLEKALDDIPDARATESSVAVLNQTVGHNKVDPMEFRFINVKMNPFYHMRMGWEKVQRWFYNRAAEEKQLLEFKLMNLKMEQAGKSDARLQETIEKVEARVSKLQYQMQEYENG